jgi:flavin-dependent dehydrogenase
VSRYDVVICGGGVAGLTLALQLKEARPATSILVAEKNQHPVPEAAHKVGESTVEVGAHYLRDVLHLEDYLREHQLDKFGLRMFCSSGDNSDITRRPELGARKWAPLGSYQLDRGRLENALGQDVAGRGIAFHGGCRVQEITLRPQDEYHRLRLLMDGSQTREVDARWIVDASGRASLLKRQLGLAKEVGHEANAVWFRVSQRIDIGQWSDDPEWLGRIVEGQRGLSTNHLMGPGYWVWLIPLASGSTSIGIVTDARIHRFEEMNRFDRAMEWLREHEPQCAQMVEPYRDQIQDFRVLRNYAYGCKQVYSASRWCLTGEAGAFLDPFYSPGMDMIAISNSLVTDLVVRALDGADVSERAAVHDRLYLRLFAGWLHVFEQQYRLMGSARVMLTKIVWDTAAYWALPGLLSFHNKWRDLAKSPPLAAAVVRFSEIGPRIQRFFREWHAVDHSEQSVPFVSFYDFDFMVKLHVGMAAGLSGTDLVAQVAANLRLLEQVAGQLVSTVTAECSRQAGNAEMREQVERWKGDSLLTELVGIYEMESPRNPIGDEWIAFKQSTISG